MKTALQTKQAKREGSILAYFILVLVAFSTMAGLAAYVTQTTRQANRRSDMIAAQQYAEAGAVIACSELNRAVTNKLGTLATSLATNSGGGYTRNDALSTTSTNVYERTIASPFTNQTVKAQIWLPTAPSPLGAKVVGVATTRQVTQQAAVNVKLSWAYPAAIISTGTGTASTGLDKGTAQDGNVVVDGDRSGPIVVDGGPGLAIMANGRANIDPLYATVPGGAISMTNRSTANQIPDYTAQGTANTLFDFARFIAVANATTNGLNTATRNNHFTNLTTFIAACNAVVATPARFLEGVIVVDIKKADPAFGNLDVANLPSGINVKGTLFFNFEPAFAPLDKIVNEATMNINPANLAGLVATNPATYTSGYPPVYYDNSKNPVNINIATNGFANFVPGEDLPAMMYSMGTLDIHGSANISGVCYTPSYMEIENKKAGQIQYFRGSMIMGLGILYQNKIAATSIISFDPPSLDSLATLSNAGKQVAVAYWQ